MIEPTYAELKALTVRGERAIRDLLALSPNHDPWSVGMPARQRNAEWFAELWARHGTQGDHLRRVHYRLVSQTLLLLMPDGLTPYVNTEACWDALVEASKGARYLRLVDPRAFVDRRNPEPHLYVAPRQAPAVPDWWMNLPDWSLPSIDAQLSAQVDLSLPTPYVTGYDYAVSDQPFHLEVWCEKSTVDDVLLPICEELGANYVTGLGNLSITATMALIQRVLDRDKPSRVFYITDFDPAGDGMPVSIARQIQWLAHDYAPDAEFKLTPLALTAEQVRQYALPRTPIKDSDVRKGAFETRHGEGATELDALEALYPGELATLVTAALEPYVDRTLPLRLARQRRAANDDTDLAWAEYTVDLDRERQTLEDNISTVVEPFADELDDLADRLRGALAPFAERLTDLRRAVQERIDDFEPVLPDRLESEINVADETEWLFDSNRGYFEQNRYYQARRRPDAGLQ